MHRRVTRRRSRDRLAPPATLTNCEREIWTSTLGRLRVVGTDSRTTRSALSAYVRRFARFMAITDRIERTRSAIAALRATRSRGPAREAGESAIRLLEESRFNLIDEELRLSRANLTFLSSRGLTPLGYARLHRVGATR